MQRWAGSLLIGFGLMMAALPHAFADAGAAGFNTNCALCHQTAGQGLAGQFPRIAGRVNSIASTPSGRQYLGSLILYGMSGKIAVDGSVIIGVMPPFAALSDGALADILNYVMRFSKQGKVASFTAAEIKALRRTPPLSATAVHALRSDLKASEAIQP